MLETILFMSAWNRGKIVWSLKLEKLLVLAPHLRVISDKLLKFSVALSASSFISSTACSLCFRSEEQYS